MDESVLFTRQEEQLLEGKSIFLLKQSVTAKLLSLFGLMNDSLQNIAGHCPLPYKGELLKQSGKISKGENYLGFPWMILDFPRQFGKEDVFAFRSLCWWGNEFSFTLHLSGKYLHAVDDLPVKLNKLNGKNLYICISESPWNYHFEKDNYIYLETFLQHADEQKINDLRFLKLSRRIDIHETSKVVNEGCSVFETLTQNLFTDPDES